MPTSTLRYCAASPPRLTCAFPLPVSLARCDDLSVLIVWECQGGCRVVQWVKGREGARLDCFYKSICIVLVAVAVVVFVAYTLLFTQITSCWQLQQQQQRRQQGQPLCRQALAKFYCTQLSCTHTYTHTRAHENTHTDTDARY